MKKITEVAHDLLIECLKEGCTVVDFTLGNGHDTTFFLTYPVRKVYAFEIQEEVLRNTQKQYQDDRIVFIQDGHERVCQYIKEPIHAGIFNFGYCPCGDKTCTTKVETSKQAVHAACSLLAVHARLVLVLYPGHEAGREEADYFLNWAKTLDKHIYETASWRMENRHAPCIVCIEKIREAAR